MAESVVALVTRKGNPKNVSDWSDLTRSHLPIAVLLSSKDGGSIHSMTGSLNAGALVRQCRERQKVTLSAVVGQT